MESVVMAFVLGGIMGAVTALHLSGAKKIGVKVDRKQRPQRR